MTNHRHDRDAIVDGLLARIAHGTAEPVEPCLDAETLAAWADNALDSSDLAAAQAHAAGCGRCQAMLAAMARTATAAPAAPAPVRRMPSLRWLVPLTAAAAAATIWIVVSPREGPVTVRQVSQITEPAQPLSPATAPAATGSPAEKMSTPRRVPEPAGQRQGLEQDLRASSNSNPAPVRPESAQAANAPAATAPAPSAAPSPAPSAAARVLSFAAANPVVISPDPAIQWRILPGGAVQRSSDGGASWQTQSTGVAETLSAGSSPSPSVCWLVGPGGTVVLSVDGRSWRRLPFPEAVSLIAVRATNDQIAAVTTSEGLEWVTEDAGRTWAKAAGR